MNQTLTEQERTISASRQAAWVLSKHNKPFTDAEVFKECIVAVLEELATDKSVVRNLTPLMMTSYSTMMYAGSVRAKHWSVF